ncbi:MAG: hypothetical protein RSC06_00525 [Clostridia bacterium]
MARPNFDASDVSGNRVKGGLGYLLFFVPLIACPASKYGRYCANQGLLLWIAFFVLRIAFWVIKLVLGWVPIVGGLLGLIGGIASCAIGLICLYFTYLACVNGDAREVPIIGQYTIIK